MAAGRPWSIEPQASTHNKDSKNPVGYWRLSYKKLHIPNLLPLKTASVLWPDMQGIGHAAVGVYHNCPITP